ncbi:MAG: M15 family metallopeptidase [Nitrospirota bacterium]|nr:M15 family metallopeptidase [Nitrospirota bacterium]
MRRRSAFFKKRLLALIGALLALLAAGYGVVGMPRVMENPGWCSYDTWDWSTVERRAVNHRQVRHPYADLAPDEIDPATGCTVCAEDQTWVRVPGVASFQACLHLAGQVEAALSELMDSGFPVITVTGYRPGRTRGEPDAGGLRTGFSNHSYGIAIDINAGWNGLYDRCIQYGPGCRLMRGGEWRPGEWPESILPDGPVVAAMQRAGLRWGGEIAGRQKDFMHFSPSGY